MYGYVDGETGGLQEVGDEVALDDFHVDGAEGEVGGGQGGAPGLRAGGGRGSGGLGGEERAPEELKHVLSLVWSLGH